MGDNPCAADDDVPEKNHGCGHCLAKFETMEELDAHLKECDTYVCAWCGFETTDFGESLDHRPCDESEPVRDVEAEWREAKRARERADRKTRRQERYGLM